MRNLIGVVLILGGMFNDVYGLAIGDTINQLDKNGMKEGLWVAKYKNGQIKYEGYFRADRPVKLMTRYYDNGDIKSKFVYYDNDKACAAHVFYRDSVLMSQGLYRNEKRDSTWTFYNKKGEKLAMENYNLGVKHGASVVFYGSGQVFERITYTEGLKTGLWKQFFESGILKVEGAYTDDKLEGWTKFYNIDGIVSHEGWYRKNVKDSTWNHYNDEGKLEIQQKYAMGHLKNKKEVSDYIQKKSEER